MHRHRKRKYIISGSAAAILSVVLAVVLLAACSSLNGSDRVPTAFPSGTTERQGGNERLDIRILIDGPANAYLPPEQDDFVRKAIEEKFNVRLRIEHMVPGPDYENRLNAHLSANDPPDMWRDVGGDGGNKYSIDGILADITNVVTPQTMPNYFNYWMDEQTFRRYQSQGQTVRAPVPYNKELYRAWYIRKDWLNRLGLRIPQSYDEYVEVLKAFTRNDPDGNGKDDTYGFTTAAAGDGIGLDWPEYWKSGLVLAHTRIDGRYVDFQTDDRMTQVLTDVAERIADGVVDPDWFMNKSPQHIDKAVQGKAGVVMGSVLDFAFESNPYSIQSRTRLLFPEADWVPFTPFGNHPIQSGIAPGTPFLFPKSVAESDPEKITRIVRILDWLAGEEGFLLTHYGLEGRHYTRSGSTITLLPEAIAADITTNGNWLAIWDFFTPATPNVLNLNVVDPSQTDRDRSIAKALAAIPSAPYIGTNLLPPIGFDLVTFRKRQRELQAKAVLEDKSGKNWPAYREELMTKYGGNELFQGYNEQIRAVNTPMF